MSAATRTRPVVAVPRQDQTVPVANPDCPAGDTRRQLIPHTEYAQRLKHWPPATYHMSCGGVLRCRWRKQAYCIVLGEANHRFANCLSRWRLNLPRPPYWAAGLHGAAGSPLLLWWRQQRREVIRNVRLEAFSCPFSQAEQAFLWPAKMIAVVSHSRSLHSQAAHAV